jgi:hypothetical protein
LKYGGECPDHDEPGGRMSVLIEAVTMVVPKRVLDVSYPGGTEAFVLALAGLERPPRFVCDGDPELVAASFSDQPHLRPAYELLEEYLVCDDGERFMELALVEQRQGPPMPCEWLEWKNHKDGFTYAWHAGGEPGDLAVPEEWTPEQSRALVRRDIRDEPGRAMRLSSENGRETWLDLTTGHLVDCLAREAGDEGGAGESAPAEQSPAALQVPGPLMAVVFGVLDGRGWEYQLRGPNLLNSRVRNGRFAFDLLFLAEEEAREVCCGAVFTTRVPESRRMAVVEALARANWGLSVGNFEMDFSDGEVRFRTGVALSDGELTPGMVEAMLQTVLGTSEFYHDAVMRVAFGEVEPGVAIGEAEKG